ncbi:hypothetical protein SUGI_0682780 [Cryptomeria japonica]|nr:hypothetical protein SUGI_0682780 [Cryptomeria japonica]
MLKDFLRSWPNSVKSSKWAILWVVSPSMLIWHLWKERNCRIFNEEALEVDVLISKIKHAIEEVVKVKSLGRTFESYTKWDMVMKNIWSLPMCSDNKFSDSKSCRKNIKWSPPHPEFLKMKFDGACRGNASVSRYGAIIQDESGDMMGAKFGLMGVSTNNIAEVIALEVGLE